MFKIGFENATAMVEKSKKSFASNRIYDFYLKPNEEGLMRFLTDQPVSFRGHIIKDNMGIPHTYVCTEDASCLGCQQPDGFDPTKPNKASVKVAFLVLDGREVEVDEKIDGVPTGKKKIITNQVRVLIRGVSNVSEIQRNANKYGLLNRAYYCSKGADKKSPYIFDRVDGCPKGKEDALWGQHELSQEALDEVIEKLPECYQEMAKQPDGFYKVLESLFKPYGETTTVEEPQGLVRV